MISHPSDLQPDTPWSETIWAGATEEGLVDHQTPARLCVATLLPFQDGKPDWQGFEVFQKTSLNGSSTAFVVGQNRSGPRGQER